MLNPLNKLLYFKDREGKEMQCKNSTRCQAQVSVLGLDALLVQEMSGVQ